MAKHNKKRNVGLIHEQLIRKISEHVVDKDQDNIDKIFNIIENNFVKGSELYKEFRLFNSLVHSRVGSKEIASKILEESKSAAKKHNISKIDQEKSKLIKEINHNLDGKDLYSTRVETYKVFSTVQALLNEWRGHGNLFPEEIVKYESLLENWLCRGKEENQNSNKVGDPLVLKMMIQKFNEKYEGNLNNMQRSLIASKLSEDNEKVLEQVSTIKEAGLKKVNDFYSSCDNKFLLEKKEEILSRIDSLEVSSSDKIIERAMSLANLVEELESEDE